MENQIAKIGTITFTNCSENVILNNNFSIDELKNIMTNDKDFVRFEVIHNNEVIFSTDGDTVKTNSAYNPFCLDVVHEKQVVGTTYNAFGKTPYTYKYKHSYGVKIVGEKITFTNWNVKKQAIEYLTQTNERFERNLIKLILK